MRTVLAVLLLGVIAFGARAEPQIAIPLPSSPHAPQAIVVISCRADDLTGLPGRHGVDPVTGEYDPSMAAKNWRDLELHVQGGELDCKREAVEVLDQNVVVNDAVQLNANFGEPAQCARAASLFFTTTQWDAHHQSWAVVGVGCPTPITDEQGRIAGWHMPECPSKLGALEGIKCKFDESAV